MSNTSNGSSIWPYVVLGSAIGGAVGYLMTTETGRKVRHTITHPDELSGHLEGASDFLEEKTRAVTDKVHGAFEKAKLSISEGERAYQQAADRFRSQVGNIGTRKAAASAHNTVNKLSDMAETVEHSVFSPICDIAAIYRGVHRGVRVLLGKAHPHRLGRRDTAVNL